MQECQPTLPEMGSLPAVTHVLMTMQLSEAVSTLSVLVQ